MLTWMAMPPTEVPLSPLMAASASDWVGISTKPNPRGSPVALSVMRLILVTSPKQDALFCRTYQAAQPTCGCFTTLPRRKQRIPVRSAHDQRLAIVSVCALQEKVRVNAGRGANMVACALQLYRSGLDPERKRGCHEHLCRQSAVHNHRGQTQGLVCRFRRGHQNQSYHRQGNW